MIGCMQHSLNVCLSWIAKQMGPKMFYDYLNRFGIGHITGIDLANEAVFPLRTPMMAYGTMSIWPPIHLGRDWQ